MKIIIPIAATGILIGSWLTGGTARAFDQPPGILTEATPKKPTSPFPTLQGQVEIWAQAEITPGGVTSTAGGAPVLPMQPTVSADTSQLADGKDYESAFRQAEWIGVCEYRGYQDSSAIGVHNPPTARFYCKQCLKGPPLSHAMLINLQFCNSAEMTAPGDWKFDAAKMPEVGSQWIIFIPNAVQTAGQAFDTYKGAYGRQEANEHNLGMIYAIIESHHGQTGPMPISDQHQSEVRSDTPGEMRFQDLPRPAFDALPPSIVDNISS